MQQRAVESTCEVVEALRGRIAELMAQGERQRRRLLEAAAERCAAAGWRRIALFGAGRHTAPIVRQPWQWYDVRVVAVVDDDPRVATLGGVPVVRPGELREPIDAVVVSSDAHEPRLFERATAMFGGSGGRAGVPVLRIYGGGPGEVIREEAGASVTRLVSRWGLSEADARWLVANREERHDATLPMLPPARTEMHLRRYEFAGVHARGKRVLDCASGTGYGARVLLGAGAASVVGVELDSKAVDYARRRFGSAAVEYRCADACATGLADGSVGLVTSFETIEHVPEPAALLREFARVLSADGVLVLSTPNDGALTEHHVQTFTPRALGEMLSRWFTKVEWYGQRAGDEPRQEGLPAGVFRWEEGRRNAETLVVVARGKAHVPP